MLSYVNRKEDKEPKGGRPAKHLRTELGWRLYDARKAKGISSTQMAKLLDISQGTYSLWERRNVALRFDQIQKLMTILEIDANTLFGDRL